jgi:hypothetical protein
MELHRSDRHQGLLIYLPERGVDGYKVRSFGASNGLAASAAICAVTSHTAVIYTSLDLPGFPMVIAPESLRL